MAVASGSASMLILPAPNEAATDFAPTAVQGETPSETVSTELPKEFRIGSPELPKLISLEAPDLHPFSIGPPQVTASSKETAKEIAARTINGQKGKPSGLFLITIFIKVML